MSKVDTARLELSKLHGFLTGKERNDIRLFKQTLEIIRNLENKNKYKNIDTFRKGLTDIEFLFRD